MHLGIIPDGFRRYAKANDTEINYKSYMNSLVDVIDLAFDSGFKIVSIFVWSLKNNDRPVEQQKAVFDAIDSFLPIISAKYPVATLGNDHARSGLSAECYQRNQKHITSGFSFPEHEKSVILLWDYDGQDWIRHCVQWELPVFIPDVDLVIRTGGEQRLSGFLPYESTYAEFSFIPKLFPDVTMEDWKLAIEDFKSRDRRFSK